MLRADPAQSAGAPSPGLRRARARSVRRRRTRTCRPPSMPACRPPTPALGWRSASAARGIDRRRRAGAGRPHCRPNPATRWSRPILASSRSEQGRPADAIPLLRERPGPEPRLLPGALRARAGLARTGDRATARRRSRELLAQLPADAPQRAEVERLARSAAMSGGHQPGPLDPSSVSVPFAPKPRKSARLQSLTDGWVELDISCGR